MSIEDFWKAVAVGDPLECWEWTGAKNSGGRGILRFGSKTITAPRIAYALTKGSFFEWLYICHTCDNPLCCNPHHMFVGTPQENTLDAQQKGRLNTGAHRQAESMDLSLRLELLQ